MPYVEVFVEADDYISDVSTEALRRELDRRLGHVADTETHPWTALGIAQDLRTAFYARNASRFEAILSVLEDVGRKRAE
jgi:hypothetical protein